MIDKSLSKEELKKFYDSLSKEEKSRIEIELFDILMEEIEKELKRKDSK